MEKISLDLHEAKLIALTAGECMKEIKDAETVFLRLKERIFFIEDIMGKFQLKEV